MSNQTDYAASVGADLATLANASVSFAKISPAAITLCSSIELDSSVAAVPITHTTSGANGGVQFGGGSTSQKFGFYNATPIAQRAGAAQAAVVTTAATQTTPYGFATQAQADNLVALANELRAALVALGLIKGAA